MSRRIVIHVVCDEGGVVERAIETLCASAHRDLHNSAFIAFSQSAESFNQDQHAIDAAPAKRSMFVGSEMTNVRQVAGRIWRQPNDDRYESNDGYVIAREYGQLPSGAMNPGFWVARSPSGAMLDWNQYRHDLLNHVDHEYPYNPERSEPTAGRDSAPCVK